jgi:hypothetical protein
MLSKEPQLAPAPVIVRYLAVFQRALIAIQDYTRNGDKPGMLLGGWLADALHNVPAMLWHSSHASEHTPEAMDIWMNSFPDMLIKRAAPARLVEDSRRIVSAEGAAHELGLREDLTDLELASLPKMREYLNMIYEACVLMRGMRNYGTPPFTPLEAQENVRNVTPGVNEQMSNRLVYTPWSGLEYAWTEDAQTHAVFNGRMATLLQPVPQALVHWVQFDRAQWVRTVLEAIADLPDDHQQWWRSFFIPQAS